VNVFDKQPAVPSVTFTAHRLRYERRLNRTGNGERYTLTFETPENPHAADRAITYMEAVGPVVVRFGEPDEVERLKKALKLATEAAIAGWGCGDGERAWPAMADVRRNAKELL